MQHSKLSRVHKRNPTFTSFSICGIGGPGTETRIHLTDSWSKVNCGNCRAHSVGAEEPLKPANTVRQLYQDSTPGSPTVWEHEEVPGSLDRMWPLSFSGERLPTQYAPTYRQVENMYGPLTRVSPEDFMMRYLRSLESRLYEGNL